MFDDEFRYDQSYTEDLPMITNYGDNSPVFVDDVSLNEQIRKDAEEFYAALTADLSKHDKGLEDKPANDDGAVTDGENKRSIEREFRKGVDDEKYNVEVKSLKRIKVKRKH